MPLFDAENRLRSDPCALQKSLQENHKLAQWQLTATRHGPRCDRGPAASELVAQNRNLSPWDGYGINACTVDDDSKMRYDTQITHTRCRQQLTNRLFKAVPNLQRGTVLPGLESRIQAGADTSSLRECNRISEMTFDVFHPALLACGQSSAAEGESAFSLGRDVLASSRDIARSDEFLASLGYAQDAFGWHRA